MVDIATYTKLQKKAEKIKAVLFDVDGVLTDGGIYYSESGEELKRFNVRDGQIVKHLQEQGILLGIITGRKSAMVDRRAKELQLDFYQQGVENKIESFKLFKTRFMLRSSEIAYIGDDINDLPVLRKCGLSASPSNSKEYIRTSVDYVTESRGGDGAFRDFADFILESKGLLKGIIG
jgi:3-deoxy-D-manno-octulosonate 8-phosphate phosphatase (KDO 8-P phosphatase)